MKTLLAAFVADINQLDSDFFAASKKERAAIIEKKLALYPPPLCEYLTTVTPEVLVSDIQGLIESVRQGRVCQKTIAQALAKSIIEEIASYIDADYAGASEAELGKIIHKSALALSLRELRVKYSQEELFNRLWRSLQVAGETKRIFVQTARPLANREKVKFRKQLAGDGFVIFQVVPSVLGGVRIFTPDGLVDGSWRKHIEKLGHLDNSLS